MKKENNKYVIFMIQYIKNHKYYNTRRLSSAYLKEYPNFEFNIRKKLNRIFGNYVALATREGMSKILNKKSKFTDFESNKKIIEFYEQLLKGVKMRNCQLIQKNSIFGENITWRKFENLEKPAIHNGYAKFHFLGSNDNEEAFVHFKKLWDEVVNNGN